MLKNHYNLVRAISAVLLFVKFLFICKRLVVAVGVYQLVRACLEMPGEFQRVRFTALPHPAQVVFRWARRMDIFSESIVLRQQSGLVWLELQPQS